MTGSLHAYSIMLNSPNIVSLADALSTRLSGSGLTPDGRESLSKELSSLSSSGTVLYDPKNPKYLSLELNILAKEGGTIHVSLAEDKDLFSLMLSTGINSFTFSSLLSENGDRNIHM